MTTTITIQTAEHPVLMITDEQNALTAPIEQTIPPHSTTTVHIWKGRGLVLAEVHPETNDLPLASVAGAGAVLIEVAPNRFDRPLSLREGEDLGASVQQPGAPRVGLDRMLSKVKSVEYHRPFCAQHLTVAIVELTNGFVLVGKAAPADAKNYDRAVGEKFAYDDAIRQLWPLEGYLLREELSKAA